jgi:DNA-binding GntR family transcriptional regulator
MIEQPNLKRLALPLTRPSTPEIIAERLREAILRGDIRPGTPLREANLTETAGVSRNTLREAFRLLSQDGLVTYHAHRGVTVTTLTPHDARDIYRVRLYLEPLGLKQLAKSEVLLKQLQDAAQSIERAIVAKDWWGAFGGDTRFHGTLVEAAESERLTVLHRAVMQELRLAHLMFEGFAWQSLSAAKQHGEIARLLKRGEVAKAKLVLTNHLESSQSALLKLMT